MPTAPRPALTRASLPADEVAPFYAGYVGAVPAGETIDDALAGSLAALDAWLTGVAESRAGYAYAPGKWTVAQALQHVVDSERVFAYRSLCFARGGAAALAGFDQDVFAAAAPAGDRGLADLLGELRVVRAGTRALFASFGDDALTRRGTASGVEQTCRAWGFITAGHCYHHVEIFRERY